MSGRLARGLLLATALVPLAYSSLLFMDSVVFRAVAFRVLLAGAALATAPALVAGRLPSESFLREDRLLHVLVALLAVSLLSALTGAAPWKSVFGITSRMGGVLTLAHMIVFYVLLRLWFDERWWTRFLILAVGAAGLFAAVNVASELGWLLFRGSDDLPALTFVFGNPGPMAAYVMVSLFLAGILYFRVSSGTARGLVLLAGALQAALLVLAKNRSALLGLGLGIAVVAAVAVAHRKGLGRALVAATGAGLVLVGLAGVAWMVLDLAAFQELVGTRWSEPSLGKRRVAWSTAMAGFLDRPWLGHGPENFALVFERFFDPSWYRISLGGSPSSFMGNVYMDRAHNAFLGAFAGTGVFGGLLYAAVYPILFVRAGRRVAGHDASTRGQALALLGLGTAMAVFLSFWFEDHAGYLLFVAMLAFAASCPGAPGDGSPDPGSDDGSDPSEDSEEGGTRSPWSLAGRAGGGALILALVVLSAVYHWRFVEATRAAHLGDMARSWGERVQHYDRALRDRPPGTQDLVIRYSTNVISDGDRFRGFRDDRSVSRTIDGAIGLGIASMRNAISRDPENPILRLRLGAIFYFGAYQFFGDRTFIGHAAQSIDEAISRAPDRIHYREMFARLMLREERPDLAIRILRPALERYAGLASTHWLYAEALHRTGDHLAAARHLVAGGALRQDEALPTDLAGAVTDSLRAGELAGPAETLRSAFPER